MTPAARHGAPGPAVCLSRCCVSDHPPLCMGFVGKHLKSQVKGLKVLALQLLGKLFKCEPLVPRQFPL